MAEKPKCGKCKNDAVVLTVDLQTGQEIYNCPGHWLEFCMWNVERNQELSEIEEALHRKGNKKVD